MVIQYVYSPRFDPHHGRNGACKHNMWEVKQVKQKFEVSLKNKRHLLKTKREQISRNRISMSKVIICFCLLSLKICFRLVVLKVSVYNPDPSLRFEVRLSIIVPGSTKLISQ